MHLFCKYTFHVLTSTWPDGTRCRVFACEKCGRLKAVFDKVELPNVVPMVPN